jgi:hypothetical protein
MKEAGLEVPAGVEFKVVENTDKVSYILLPPKPDELADEQLDAVSGGLLNSYPVVFCMCA